MFIPSTAFQSRPKQELSYNALQLYLHSVQLRHVTSDIFTVFSLVCEPILEVIEQEMLSSLLPNVQIEFARGEELLVARP